MKNLIVLLYSAGWLQVFAPHVFAQPSVYSGAFAFGSGNLNTLAKQQTITNFVNDAQKDISIINMFNSWTSGSSTNGTVSFPSGHGLYPQSRLDCLIHVAAAQQQSGNDPVIHFGKHHQRIL